MLVTEKINVFMRNNIINLNNERVWIVISKDIRRLDNYGLKDNNFKGWCCRKPYTSCGVSNRNSLRGIWIFLCYLF